MKPIAALRREDAQSLIGVLFDLDDTLLDAGQLTVQALDALYRLRGAGLLLVGVTGRPASWGLVLARQWPVAGMVTENGIIGVRPVGKRLTLVDRVSTDERQRRRVRLDTLTTTLRREFPELEPSDDVSGRIADYSFDIGESKVVSPEVIAAASQLARQQGARVIRSSIQLHVAMDGDDKASGVVHFLRGLCSVDPTTALGRFAYIGDSENDAPCFAAFRHSVGVANLSGRPSLAPRYVASKPAAAGFSEIADTLIAARNAANRTA